MEKAGYLAFSFYSSSLAPILLLRKPDTVELQRKIGYSPFKYSTMSNIFMFTGNTDSIERSTIINFQSISILY